MNRNQIKFHKLDSCEMDYPIGNNITSNLSTIKDMARAISDAYKGRRIYLWCRGSSGAIIAGIIASVINEPVVINHVKKENERSHGHLSSPSLGDVNLIVDDFIRSGETVDKIMEQVNKKNYVKIDCLCISGEIHRSFLNRYGINAAICPRLIDDVVIEYNEKSEKWVSF